MNDQEIQDIPEIIPLLRSLAKEIGFDMPCDLLTGNLLRSLVVSKPGGSFLELGTGLGFSLCWLIEGMDNNSQLTSIDNDEKLIQLVNESFTLDERVQLICMDGALWIKDNPGNKYDLIFADAWPGKYEQIDEVLNMLNPGGLYIIDDMLPQPNWPEGHSEKASKLISYLENRLDLRLTKLNWSTGVIICTKV